MKTGPQYIIERWPHGWLICSAPGAQGIPADALSECEPIFPKNSVVSPGIVHHYNVSGKFPMVIMAIGTVNEIKAWETVIISSLSRYNDETRWWLGVDVGKSAAAIFAVLGQTGWTRDARAFSNGAVPHDADDFGRCKRLIEAFPEWRSRLSEVAEAYPDTKWPAIIARWSELEAANTVTQGMILDEIRRTA